MASHHRGAKKVEVGVTATPVAPPCQHALSSPFCGGALVRVTAIQSMSDGVAYPTRVKSNGQLVAFTVGLAKVSSVQLAYEERAYGGKPQVVLTVLKPARGKLPFTWVVAAQSRVYEVEPRLGRVARLTLRPSLPVKPGDVVALTSPTWAPVMTVLPTRSPQFQWRASRTNCLNTLSRSAQLTIGATARYQCAYTGVRIEYSATEVQSAPSRS